MSEFGGMESFAPDESGGGVSESLSEEARQRFAASAAKSQQARKQEKKSKKRDKRVAATIKKFFGDKKNQNFIVLISRLSARNCPSIFILAMLSLIDEECEATVRDYLQESMPTTPEAIDDSMSLTAGDVINAEMNKRLIDWIVRMQMVLSLDPERTLMRLMLDEKNIDGTVLQLATFVMQTFFRQNQKDAPYEKLQPLTASILQAVFEPFIGQVRKRILEQHAASQAEDDDDDY